VFFVPQNSVRFVLLRSPRSACSAEASIATSPTAVRASLSLITIRVLTEYFNKIFLQTACRVLILSAQAVRCHLSHGAWRAMVRTVTSPTTVLALLATTNHLPLSIVYFSALQIA
jgi:hypothetical protein